MKKGTLSLAVALLVAGTAHAQIPVTVTSDIPATVNQLQTMAQWAQQLKSMADQYSQMQKDYEQMVREYESMTGSRNLGKIFNNAELRDYLPEDWQAVYDAVQDGGYDSLSGTAADMYKKSRYYDACASFAIADQRQACEAAAVKPTQDKAFASDAYDKAKSRLGQIEQLMSKINDTSDPKAIAELQGRIAAEQAMIQNEQTKLQLYAMMTQAEEKVQQQRQHEINAKQLARRGHLDLQPMTFD